MSSYNGNNKFFSYIILLFSLFILALFTKGEFSKVQENLDSKEGYTFEKQEKESKLQELNALRERLKQDSYEWSEYVKKLSAIATEDKLIDYIYGYVEDSSDKDPEILVKDVSLAELNKNELWFNQLDLNVGLRVSSELAMINFLNFILDKESEYFFFINKFSYPNW